MKNIKVTVEYEVPKTSKFDALMAEYEAAKKLADETVSYYKPLADAAEEAKMLAILEQIKTIQQYAQTLSTLEKSGIAVIRCRIDSCQRGPYCVHDAYFEVRFDPNGEHSVFWDGNVFNIAGFRRCKGNFVDGSYNILGNWDRWQVYRQLEENACKQIKAKIDQQKTRANNEKNRLNNITKGGI